MFCHYLQKYHRHSLNKTKNIFGDLFVVQCELIKIILRFKEKLKSSRTYSQLQMHNNYTTALTTKAKFIGYC